MVKFAYNNTMNISTSYMLFEMNCGYHSHISFEDDVNLYLKFHLADKLANELRNLISISQQNLLYT